MEKDTITIPRREYEKLKMIESQLDSPDLDLLIQFKRSLQDVKAGRIRKVA